MTIQPVPVDVKDLPFPTSGVAAAKFHQPWKNWFLTPAEPITWTDGKITLTATKITVGSPTRKSNRSPRTSVVYWSIEGYNPIDEMTSGYRYNRPHSLYRKLLPKVLALVKLEGCHARWSQYAGCTCPCSPGFILDSYSGYSYFVTYTIQINGKTVAGNQTVKLMQQEL